MGYVKIDTRLPEHPDVRKIDRRVRCEAIGSWVSLASWCAGYDHTGFVPQTIVKRHVRKPVLAALVAVGLLDVDPAGEGHYLAHGNHNAFDLWRIERNDYRRKIPTASRERVYIRDGRACVACGSPDDLTLDHIHPWSLGGSDHISNLQTLCRSCNARKGAKV